MGYSLPHGELTFREDTLYAESVVHCPHFPPHIPLFFSGSLPLGPRASFPLVLPFFARPRAAYVSKGRALAPVLPAGAGVSTSAQRQRYVGATSSSSGLPLEAREAPSGAGQARDSLKNPAAALVLFFVLFSLAPAAASLFEPGVFWDKCAERRATLVKPMPFVHRPFGKGFTME
ncbi:hypothetical protein MRX96_029122 [Rhipicephalus microplus]